MHLRIYGCSRERFREDQPHDTACRGIVFGHIEVFWGTLEVGGWESPASVVLAETKMRRRGRNLGGRGGQIHSFQIQQSEKIYKMYTVL
jgi:hypothetical protein